jgi:putative peptidoglycan lipid II flippase
MCSIYSAILNAHGKFALSAAMPIILNIILILSVLVTSYFEKNILTILSAGVIVAGILQITILIFSLKQNKIEISFLKLFIKLVFKSFLNCLFQAYFLLAYYR